MNRGVLIILLVSFFANIVLAAVVLSLVNTPSSLPEENQYAFLAKRLFVQNSNDVLINFTQLRQELTTYAKSTDVRLGIYFEYLPTGIHIGINDREPFRRASLVKVPVAMEVYRLYELGKLQRGTQLIIKKNHIDPLYGTLWKKGVGTKITADEAVKAMLVDSDNTAFNLLRDTVNKLAEKDEKSEEQILSIYDYVDIPRGTGGTIDISPRNFSSILKSLYFSAYISYESSNELLNIMSHRSKTYNMLSAPIPENIPVAHKFGVNDVGTEAGFVTSDCGIFYVPQRPYILCVMVNTKPEKAATIIANISGRVYKFVSTVNP